jgi:hypothetical protein
MVSMDIKVDSSVASPAFAETDYLHEAFRVVRLRAGRLPQNDMINRVLSF